MKKASGMLAVFFLLTIFIVGSAFSFYQVSVDIKQNARYVFEEKSFWLAESGINYAEYALNNEEWDAWTDQSGDKFISYSTEVGDVDVFVTGLGTANGSISSYGYVPSKSVTNKYIKNIVVDFDGEKQDPRLFKLALFSRNNLLIKNDVIIDSYISDDGPYGGANVLENGTVGAHSSSLALHDNVIVYGDLEVIESTNVKVLKNASYTGDINIVEKGSLDADSVPDDLAALAADTNISLSANDQLVLDSGNYAYAKVNLDTNAQIIVNGDVRIRIDNSLNLNDFSNITVNGTLVIYADNGISLDDDSFVKSSTSKPGDIIIYGPGNNASSDFSGNSKFYGVMYAPDGTISFNDQAQLFGAVAARVANFSQQAQLHYDELLGTEGAGASAYGGYQRLNWNEV